MHIGSKLLASAVCITLLSGCEILLAPVIIPAAVVYYPISLAMKAREDNETLEEKLAAAEDKARADKEDADAMYAQAIGTDDPVESWKYHCLAANKNHPDAQISIADHYLQGRDPAKRDLLKAYVWYRLAESNGYEGGQDTGQQIKTETEPVDQPYSEVLAANMTPSELADGQRLVSEWKPNPAECAMEAKLAAD